jgi:hypothetical protein
MRCQNFICWILVLFICLLSSVLFEDGVSLTMVTGLTHDQMIRRRADRFCESKSKKKNEGLLKAGLGQNYECHVGGNVD